MGNGTKDFGAQKKNGRSTTTSKTCKMN